MDTILGLIVAAEGFRALSDREIDNVLDSFGEPGEKETVENILSFEARVFSRPEEYLANLNSLSDEDKTRVMAFAQYAVRKSIFTEIDNFLQLEQAKAASENL